MSDPQPISVASLVEGLLDYIYESNRNRPEFTPAMSREQAESIILAVASVYGCRAGDFASAYAYEAFFRAVGLEHWPYQPEGSAIPVAISAAIKK